MGANTVVIINDVWNYFEHTSWSSHDGGVISQKKCGAKPIIMDFVINYRLQFEV